MLMGGVAAIPVILTVVWFTHGHRTETSEPSETRTPSSNRAASHASPGGDLPGSFHTIAGDQDTIHRDADLAALARRWVGKDPREALDFARRLPPGEVRETFLRQLSVTWAGKDIKAALAWSDQLENESERRHVRSLMCIAFSETGGNSGQALELAIEHGADEGGDGLLENLTMQWATRETPAALEWARRQPAGEWSDRLMARVVFILAKSDPFHAACQVAEEMEPGPMQNEAMLSVLHQWAKSDLAAASDWAGNLPTGVLRDRAMNELAGLQNSVAE